MEAKDKKNIADGSDAKGLQVFVGLFLFSNVELTMEWICITYSGTCAAQFLRLRPISFALGEDVCEQT